MAGKRILHIEDNPSNRKAVRHILRQTDFELTEEQRLLRDTLARFCKERIRPRAATSYGRQR